MNKMIISSALAVAALGATLATSKTAGATGWFGSGWYTLGAYHQYSVSDSGGGTYTAGFLGDSANVASVNVTGTSSTGHPTCQAASLLCSNYDFIIAPYLCENTAEAYESMTDVTTNGVTNGQYWQDLAGNYYPATDTGNCPSAWPGAWEGAFVYQW